jgi:Rps23 Pro-64 3,4-dihydroxylase Tpa1-like proline 4-hydroxylase
LAKTKCALVKKFRDEILYGKFLDFLKNVTNIDLSSTKIDVTSSKYDFSDYLLCHDDDIHDTNNFGRRVAFVFYLVPDDWCTDGSDGGNLDMFKVDGTFYLDHLELLNR